MMMRTKIFVVLAFIAAIFYAFMAYLTFMQQGMTWPVIVKTAMVVAFLYYGMSRITKARAESTRPDVDQR